ncbi:THUMP domain-containing class I SAM-dependent RNA methyltransferase [Achromobacter denitrificans]|uniref:THUMP domain-containing class I SAM-dependent RNA methyltransferase n=1 Tax=Achromobacter denitrificans TaxID=32002 RepID=UPI001465E432|nr:class I SAM-dependent RNA methyltransferase [Achromobacter denitrificans]CAB3813409.1 Ribosomal RNA large subunit methyltransferase K/L [Achromobacter denitrificans]
MSSDEQDRPRKTLTIKKTARDAHAEAAPKRVRSGARARLVAQQERAKDNLERQKDPEGYQRRQQESERGPRKSAAAGERGPAGRGQDARGATRRADAGQGSRPRRDDGPGSRSGRAPKRAPRLDDQYIAPATPAGRFYDPFEDDGPAPEYLAESEAARAAELAEAPERAPIVETRGRRPRETRQAEVFPIFAPCPQGLEEALTAEMQALGFEDAQVGRAGCSFTADWSGVQRANLYSRLATRILVQVAHAEISHEDDILDLARDTPWERWFGAEQTLRVDTSAIKSPVQSLQYCNLRAKDGICDRLREREGERPSIDTVRPDARVHLFLTGHTATLYLDTSGESLFKRGWRLDKGEAPLRENLAAGMLALAGWDPAAPLLDPFCGSGTILIEGAWIALGVPPGISRPFGFERLRGHDAYRWRDLKEDARSRILPQLDAPLVGYDLDPQAIEYARNNAERAWLTADSIRFEVGDARDITAPADHGWIVTNPPYGERMGTEQDPDLWRDWAACLKRNFAGWQLHAITSDLTLPNQMRLKPKRRVPLHNGSLDCRLFGFELVAAGYRDA